MSIGPDVGKVLPEIGERKMKKCTYRYWNHSIAFLSFDPNVKNQKSVLLARITCQTPKYLACL